MGGTSEEVAKQRKLFNSMNTSEKQKQEDLREKQVEEKERLDRLPEVPVPPADSDVMMPMIYVTVCWPGNDYYKVNWSHGTQDCFANAGTYNMQVTAHATNLRPGNNVGRLYYSANGYYYYSPWRGKTMTTYYFTAPVLTHQVIIQ